jgi:type II restriction/modification system DNA methylase subunit YeeA
MPVNTAALKTFAPAMRRQLLEAVGRKLDLLLHSQTPDTLSTYAKQIAELREQEAENREQLLERVAYTWFNRLCALRYLDSRGWHPFGCKVLMPAAEGETQPELLKLMRAGSLPAELRPHTNEARLHGLLDGQIPPAIAGADPQGEVYRELVLASCRSYHQLLPELFEGLDDASELLLPDDLLSEGSIAGGFRSAISDEDCQDVEIIGWLYQFYISEKKDQVIGKVVKSEDIPAATQLFTPNWIVKYMVQNSLGATWLTTYPDSPLKGQMEFYIEPAEQSPEVQEQLAAITPESLDPEELTLIDPACGSGHILVEAYDLLKAIYLERGYRQRDIPELILTKNLYGLDICPRAAQLTAFSLLMKGREDDRRFLERGIQLNVMALQDSTGFDVECLAASVDLSATGVSRADVRILFELFTHATTFGSLIQVPPVLTEKLPALSRLAQTSNLDLFAAGQLHQLRALVRQAEILAQRYDTVATNPPYMSSKYQTAKLKKFTQDTYPGSKSDLFAAFIERGNALAKDLGFSSMITMQSWMFLSSFQALREVVLREKTIRTLAHLGARAFGSISGEIVQTAASVIQSKPPLENKPVFYRLVDGNEEEKCASLLSGQNRFDVNTQTEFKKIHGSPIAYWMSDGVKKAFSNGIPLGEVSSPRKGNSTSDNSRFLRCWHEVCLSSVGLGLSEYDQRFRWIPYNKGGGFLKWYGHNSFLIDWKDKGEAIRQIPTAVIANESHFFAPGLTWSTVTVGSFSIRWFGSGFIFDNGGCCIFGASDLRLYLMALLNSAVFPSVIGSINPTVNFQSGEIAKFPVILNENIQSQIDANAKDLLLIAKDDWNSYERSWDFHLSPILGTSMKVHRTLRCRYEYWISTSKETASRTKDLEEENNRLFIEVYGLQDELSPEVPIEQITLTVNPAYRYGGNLSEEEQWGRFRRDTMTELLSYGAGCMMGRYSIDQPGLILADSRDNQAEQLAAYEAKVGKPLSEAQFKPDPDGIIPVLDGEWFEDDIVARTREFLAVTFPESSVGENLRFIEESLGKDIRKYFCSDFYKDHLQTYKKRPIYWMVQSPKRGFACLIYLHRYTKDTLNQVLNNYFRPYLQKLEARLAQLGLDQLNDDLPTRERTAARKEAEKITKVLKECQAWEQDALLPLAQQRIELDLDDGVKVNYLKLQDVMAPIPGLAAKED